MNEEYVDVEVDGENDNDDMNDNDNDNNDFCNGMSMIMSMSGFQSALFGTKKSADCLTFLFTKWTLETPGKFQGAMGEYLAGFFFLLLLLLLLLLFS
jgi:hypothetical protein